MSEAVIIALISSVSGMLSGIVGKSTYDKVRNGRNGQHSNGSSVESVLARRAEVEFQTRMTVVMEQLSTTIERVGGIMEEAARAIREVHKEIEAHAQATAPATRAVLETHRLVKEMHEHSAAARRSAGGGR